MEEREEEDVGSNCERTTPLLSGERKKEIEREGDRGEEGTFLLKR